MAHDVGNNNLESKTCTYRYMHAQREVSGCQTHLYVNNVH